MADTSLIILRFIQKSDNLLDLYNYCFKKFMEDQYRAIKTIVNEAKIAKD